MYDSFLNKMIDSKKIYRKKLSKLSFEEKIEIIVRMQKMDLELKKSNNREIPAHHRIWKLT